MKSLTIIRVLEVVLFAASLVFYGVYKAKARRYPAGSFRREHLQNVAETAFVVIFILTGLSFFLW